MSVYEIKCPHCGKWGVWNGNIDDKCIHCGRYLEEHRFLYAQQKRTDEANKRKTDYLRVKSSDDNLVATLKQFVNWIRWGTIYGVSVVFFIIIFMVIVYGLVML
jgi:hypothetical protein